MVRAETGTGWCDSVKWEDQTIFVTGATGFIGGRVCERLFQERTGHIRALVYSPHKSARIARLPIEMVRGSLLDRESLRSALGDAETVIHCGLGNARGIVRGTKNLLEVAVAARVRQFIHMSTAAVHGLTPPPGSDTEDAPVRASGDNYCDNKRRAERVVTKFGRSMKTVILRPSIVYGPYSAWSTRLVESLRQKKVALIDDGGGACNTVYIDNLVDAIFLALDSKEAAGQIFYVTDGEKTTWGDFIGAHLAMMGATEPLPQVSGEQLRAHYSKLPGLFKGSIQGIAQSLRSRQFRELLMQIPVTQRLLSGAWDWLESLSENRRAQIRAQLGVRQAFKAAQDAAPVPDETDLATQTGTIFFSIDKARRLLGYEPRIPFCRGIALVEQWMRHATYLGP